jgi:pimeloyl-ACP methyl ester carboxylesterase
MRLALVALVAVALVGCYRLALRDLSTGAPSGQAGAVARAPVSAPAIREGAVASATGCQLRYRLYRPATPAADGLIVLGHGFLRNKERMDGLARALAAAGMATAVMDYCNARLWDGRHYRNGLDMLAVADALGAERVLYAGFSAGALAALVAGREDPRAVGVLALDLVDDRALGLRTAAGLAIPLIGLMGEPTACNARGNGLPVFQRSGLGRAQVLRGAGHCDFESPTDWLCETLCEQPAGGLASTRAAIIALAVGAAADLMAARLERDAAPERRVVVQ